MHIKPKAVIFDWDETLAETRNLVVFSMQNTLDKYNLGDWDTIKAEKRDTAKSLKENFPHFFGADSEEAYKFYLADYKKNLANGLSAATYAPETVRYLKELEIPLFIISNKEKSLLQEEINFLFPVNFFSKILGNGDALYNKPHAAPVHEALSGTGIDVLTERVWFIGDSRQDTDCALASGCLPILVGEGKFINKDYWAENIETKKIHLFEDFNSLLACIKTNFSHKGP